MTASPPWDFTTVGDLGGVGGDRDPADLGGFGAAQHVDDHRQAGDVQQRLARQAGGGHAGGNQHQSTGFGHRQKRSGPGVDNRPEMMGIGRKSAHLYGLPEHGQTDISAARGAVRKPDSSRHPRPRPPA